MCQIRNELPIHQWQQRNLFFEIVGVNVFTFPSEIQPYPPGDGSQVALKTTTRKSSRNENVPHTVCLQSFAFAFIDKSFTSLGLLHKAFTKLVKVCHGPQVHRSHISPAQSQRFPTLPALPVEQQKSLSTPSRTCSLIQAGLLCMAKACVPHHLLSENPLFHQNAPLPVS